MAPGGADNWLAGAVRDLQKTVQLLQVEIKDLKETIAHDKLHEPVRQVVHLADHINSVDVSSSVTVCEDKLAYWEHKFDNLTNRIDEMQKVGCPVYKLDDLDHADEFELIQDEDLDGSSHAAHEEFLVMRIADLESKMQTMVPNSHSEKLVEIAVEIKQAEFSKKEAAMELQFEQVLVQHLEKMSHKYEVSKDKQLKELKAQFDANLKKVGKCKQPNQSKKGK